MVTMNEVLYQERDGAASSLGELSDHDLASLADWAGENQRKVPNQDWKRAYALIREGCDTLLRRRAKSSTRPAYEPMEAAVDGRVTVHYSVPPMPSQIVNAVGASMVIPNVGEEVIRGSY
jgi:hypothetical protein